MIDFSRPKEIQGFVGVLWFDIFTVLIGQWMWSRLVVFWRKLEYELLGSLSSSTKFQLTIERNFLKPFILLGFSCLTCLHLVLFVFLGSKRESLMEMKFGKWSDKSVTKLPDLISLLESLVKMLINERESRAVLAGADSSRPIDTWEEGVGIH